MFETLGGPCEVVYFDYFSIGNQKYSIFKIICWPGVCNFDHCNFEFICYLVLVIWDFLLFYSTEQRAKVYLRTQYD